DDANGRTGPCGFADPALGNCSGPVSGRLELSRSDCRAAEAAASGSDWAIASAGGSTQDVAFHPRRVADGPTRSPAAFAAYSLCVPQFLRGRAGGNRAGIACEIQVWLGGSVWHISFLL